MVRLARLGAAISLVAAAALLVVSCGGTSVRRDGGSDAGEGGDGGSAAGKGGSGATGAVGGSATGGGSAVGGGSATGGGSTAGGSAVGGASATGGSSGASAGSGPCLPTPCPQPMCPDGKIVSMECSCPVCDCSDVQCATVDCQWGSRREPGACCESCIPEPPSCDSVECEPIPLDNCGQGSHWEHDLGACCGRCVWDEPGGCLEIACPMQTCALGYVPGDLVGGCCYECWPDPKFCEVDSDCLIADRPRSCCGCPEAISVRMADADACWFNPADPGEIPRECYPDMVCDRACESCEIPSKASCVENRCVVD